MMVQHWRRDSLLAVLVVLVAAAVSLWTHVDAFSPSTMSTHHAHRILSPMHRHSHVQQQYRQSSPSSLVSLQAASTPAASDFAGNINDNSVNRPSFPLVLWRFTRPHTIIGSALAIPSLHLIAAPTLAAACTWTTVQSIAYATVPALLMNLYITGLNQMTDVDIDKVNKPDLPLAAGHLHMKTALWIVVTSLVGSLCWGSASQQWSTPGLQVALWTSGLLGTLYSVPPIRLKRFHVWAAFCIVAVRGAVINAGFYAHAQAAAFGMPGMTVGQCLLTQPRCWGSSLFFAVFGLVIALMKDVPDVLGDRLANVKTFSVRLGARQVFHGMRRLLTGLFVASGIGFARVAWQATTTETRVGRIVTAVAALGAGWSVRQQAMPVDPSNSTQVYQYYMHLWKLFYLSYFVLPFAR
jgi:homogentisate phytyltransferase / homogentisate geranylgeranyltransferase